MRRWGRAVLLCWGLGSCTRPAPAPTVVPDSQSRPPQSVEVEPTPRPAVRSASTSDLLPSGQARGPALRVSEPLAMHPGGPALVVRRRAETGVQPKSVALSPDGTRIYVCNFGLMNYRNVSVFHAESMSRIGYIHFAGNAAEAVVSADGSRLYVSNFKRGVVEIIDTQSFKVRAEVRVGSNPKFMVIDEPRGLLYVSNWSSRTVSAIDLRRRKVVRRLPTGRRPRGLAVLSDGTLLVGAMWDHLIQVYPPERRRAARQFATCENPRHLMLSPDEQRLYVSCSGERLLQWFDPQTGEVLGEAPTGRNPRTIDISDDGRHIAVADFTSSTVTLVDTETMEHRTHEVPRTKEIVGLAIAPGDDLTIYVTSWLTNRLLELTPQ